MPWHLYILECSDRSLYTGITLDLERRIETHSAKKGSKILRGKLPAKLVHREKYRTRSMALKREAEIKNWPRRKKLALIAGNLE